MENTRHIPLILAFLNGLTFVELLLASTHANHELGIAPLRYEKPERHDGESGLFAVFLKFHYLLAVKQELAVAAFGVVVVSAVKIFGDIHVFYPDLSVVDITECIDKACLTQAYRLYFSAGKHKSCSKCVGNRVVKICAAVVFFFKKDQKFGVFLWAKIFPLV